MTTSNPISCWCGNTSLADFGPEFLHCGDCQTLVSRQRGRPADEILHVGADEGGLYGKSYWFEHQEQDVGLPDITSRARTDLPERCVYWLRTLLAFKLPPANVLELGSAHGGFVAMLRSAGYDAAGLELSPYIVDFARQTFGVPMHLGPVEQQPIAPGSLDAIVMMDVLEHLPDPIGTMKHVASLLKPDGVLIAQTPRYPEHRTFAQMAGANDYFLNHMRGKAPEHLLLFSESSAGRLMREIGLPTVIFEPPIFHQYDMYFVAARQTVARHPAASQATALQATAGGRLTQALLDATGERDSYLAEANKRLAVIEGLVAEVERLK
ncbi:class I SAM-dependent methyltransferase [Humisphaera borealis]|uniref:Class I SAM-dependent methyltransferase n=1 Tax=Humisphaera borealis TaxID=2807512 RepID=A0A7M2WSH3_9BACT|nr:class I SAM-dependent methyltransferase [Humisphaera borealis]QOV88369.1 class I SAM-dependent methyltransferase [Humisphaera borealis]